METNKVTEIETIKINNYIIHLYTIPYLKRIKNLYGYIYITTNLINGKMYTGQKKIGKNNKWITYLGSGTHLKNAIKKYGKENFDKKIIDIAFNKDELNALEFLYTKAFCCVDDERWYNLCYGGGVNGLNINNSKVKRKVIQYDLEGNFIKEYDSLNEASRINKLCRNSIKNCCKGIQYKTKDRTTWRYKGESFDKFCTKEFIQPTKTVVQFNKNYEYINEYKGIREASRETGIDRSTISRSCHKKQNSAGGYIWIFKEEL